MAASSDNVAGPGSAQAGGRALSSARLAAVQAIYQMEMTGVSADTVVMEFIQHRGGAELGEEEHAVAPDRVLFAELVRGVAAEREALDRAVASLLVAEWPLERIEKVMAAILRAGAFELMHRPTVPARVVINEYVDVAHAFFAGKEPGMVNGVLDRLARILRETEMESAGKTGETPGGRRKAGTGQAG
jgi:N utilization substance protein B